MSSDIEAAIREAGLPPPTKIDPLTIEWPGLVLLFVEYRASAGPSPSFSIEQSPNPPMRLAMQQWTYDFLTPKGMFGRETGPLSYIFGKAKEWLDES